MHFISHSVHQTKGHVPVRPVAGCLAGWLSPEWGIQICGERIGVEEAAT